MSASHGFPVCYIPAERPEGQAGNYKAGSSPGNTYNGYEGQQTEQAPLQARYYASQQES